VRICTQSELTTIMLLCCCAVPCFSCCCCCSDIDLVVTGLVQPSSMTGGFESGDKRIVSTALERIARQLRGSVPRGGVHGRGGGWVPQHDREV
jgi:hypothetical protein